MNTKQAIQEIGKHTNFLPRERGVSLPLIELHNGRLIVIRLFYFTRTIPNDGTHITSPQYIGTVDMSGGEFLALKRLDDESNPPNLPPAPWKHSRFRFENAEDILIEFDKIYELYDRLIPSFVAQQFPPSDGERSDARMYLEYFEKHAEKPLLPYYEKYGGRFLAWIRKTAQP